MNTQLHKDKGFTLIELLVVMTVIVVLAGLVLTLIPYITKKMARTRTANEITAMASALENYKADNGIYPDDAVMSVAGAYSPGATDTLNAQTNGDPTQQVYTNAGLVLYRALSGDRNLDRSVTTSDASVDLTGSNAPVVSSTMAPTVYYTFKASQLLPATGTGTVTNLVDPFGYNYGYSTAYQGDIANGVSPPIHGYNPTYDLWSTGAAIPSGTSTITSLQPQWIANWQNMGQ